MVPTRYSSRNRCPFSYAANFANFRRTKARTWLVVRNRREMTGGELKPFETKNEQTQSYLMTNVASIYDYIIYE